MAASKSRRAGGSGRKASRYKTLLLERPREGIVLLTLNRPERLNAITFQMFDELNEACVELTADDEARAVVITGSGRGFCSGLDLDEAETLPDMSPGEMMLGQERWAGSLIAIRELPQPVIAAVNGAAAGGGLGIALAADIRIASPEARFNAAFVKIGLSAGDIGVSWALPRVVGLAHAAEIMFTGRFVDATEAERMGLVNRVVPADDLLDEALAMADQIVSNTPFGVMLSKRVLNTNVDAGSLRNAVEVENRGQTLATRGQDFREALSAFRAKREPRFTGR
jgi:enoyl-CoA hydratase